MNLADSERRTHPPRGHFAPRNQLGRISTPRFHDLRRRRVGPPALKRGLWRVRDLKLDEVGGRDTAHLSGKMKGGVDPRRGAGGENPIPVDHDPIVHGDRAEPGQEVERRPVRGRPLAMDETRPSKKQRARADGKDLRRASRLAAQPAENLFILHQGLLTRPAGDVQDVELRRFRQRRVRHDAQPYHVAHRVARLGIDAVGRVGEARESTSNGPVRSIWSRSSNRSDPIFR
jgi:hypothetical protein